jgi:hypothetical protein
VVRLWKGTRRPEYHTESDRRLTVLSAVDRGAEYPEIPLSISRALRDQDIWLNLLHSLIPNELHNSPAAVQFDSDIQSHSIPFRPSPQTPIGIQIGGLEIKKNVKWPLTSKQILPEAASGRESSPICKNKPLVPKPFVIRRQVCTAENQIVQSVRPVKHA